MLARAKSENEKKKKKGERDWQRLVCRCVQGSVQAWNRTLFSPVHLKINHRNDSCCSFYLCIDYCFHLISHGVTAILSCKTKSGRSTLIRWFSFRVPSRRKASPQATSTFRNNWAYSSHEAKSPLSCGNSSSKVALSSSNVVVFALNNVTSASRSSASSLAGNGGEGRGGTLACVLVSLYGLVYWQHLRGREMYVERGEAKENCWLHIAFIAIERKTRRTEWPQRIVPDGFHHNITLRPLIHVAWNTRLAGLIPAFEHSAIIDMKREPSKGQNLEKQQF